MKHVTIRSHPGNKFHEIMWAFSKATRTRTGKHRTATATATPTSTTHSTSPSDFMKFVTRMAFRSHPGNKFHEITWAGARATATALQTTTTTTATTLQNRPK